MHMLIYVPTHRVRAVLLALIACLLRGAGPKLVVKEMGSTEEEEVVCLAAAVISTQSWE